jgi:hypothetical protein
MYLMEQAVQVLIKFEQFTNINPQLTLGVGLKLLEYLCELQLASDKRRIILDVDSVLTINSISFIELFNNNYKNQRLSRLLYYQERHETVGKMDFGDGT